MIPVEQILLVAVLQFVLGLSGVLLRRDGITMVVSAAIMLNGVLLAFSAGLDRLPDQAGAEAAVTILALVIMLLVSGLSVVYSFHRFRRVVLLEEQDRMKH